MERPFFHRSGKESEGVGSSDSSGRKREEGTTSTGFGSGPAGRHHLRFTGTTTGTFHLNLDIEPLYKETEQRQSIVIQQHEAHNQAKPDLELRLGPSPVRQEPVRPVELDLLSKLGQNSQEQESANPTQQAEIYQASSSRQEGTSSKAQPLDLDLNLGLAGTKHEYTLIDIANEALHWRDSGRKKPLNSNILKFIESQDLNSYKLDQSYNRIRQYYNVKYKMNESQIEDVMLRVYDYHKTAKKI
jgi:hypothetical protein